MTEVSKEGKGYFKSEVIDNKSGNVSIYTLRKTSIPLRCFP